MFYPVGHRFYCFGNTYILAQLSEIRGTFINVESGNRYSDDFVLLELGGNGVRGTYYVPEELQEISVFSKEDKPDIVEFFRYIRPHNNTGEIDNLRGVTLRFVLNYPEDKVDVFVSICNGDNFEKQLGRDLCTWARDAYRFEFRMPEGINFDRWGGAVFWFICQLTQGHWRSLKGDGFTNQLQLNSVIRSILTMYSQR